MNRLLFAALCALRALHTSTSAPALLPPEQPLFRNSLRIAEPGPKQGPDSLTFVLTLTWSARPGAGGYRTFMWTDAAGAWYRVDESISTSVKVRAFPSGCTAFAVIAIPTTPSSPHSMAGIDTSNVVRFPLSARPGLCPVMI